MRHLLIIAIVVSIGVGASACDSGSKIEAQTEAQSESETAPQAPAPADPGELEPAAEVTEIEFDDKALTGALPAGELVGGFGFVDGVGDNFVAFSKEDVEREGAPNPLILHVKHVVREGDTFREVRAYREVVEDCEFDVVLEPFYGSWSVTDLDHDGVGEATFAYTVECVSDVSPLTHKVFVTEGGEKYVLRGTTKVRPGKDAETMGGEYEADEMPTTFRAHAREIWNETSLGFGMK